MAWRKSSVLEERLRFVVLASEAERNMKELCVEFGISRQTGYTWLERYRDGGSAAVQDRSRRPHHSPTRTRAELEQVVVELRQRWPDWGAAKLAKVLQEQRPEIRWRARTVHRILERHGCIAPEDRHPAAPQRFERAQANELWQMDFKGPQGFNRDAGVGPLSVLDDHSRYLLLLRHLGSTRMQGVQASLQEVFEQVGLPDSMLMDHGTPWWNAQSWWGLTELTIWLMRLGIRLHFSGIRHPQTQGKVERMHGALQRAIRKRAADPNDQRWLDAFRMEYNHVRPHEALAMATPASRWQPSSRAYPSCLTEWAYPAGLLCFRLAGQGQLNWRGQRWEISRALRGQVVGLQPLQQRVLVYFCRTPIRELDLQTGTSKPILGAPLRSLHG
jgi:transposase InsO family protein